MAPFSAAVSPKFSLYATRGGWSLKGESRSTKYVRINYRVALIKIK